MENKHQNINNIKKVVNKIDFKKYSFVISTGDKVVLLINKKTKEFHHSIEKGLPTYFSEDGLTAHFLSGTFEKDFKHHGYIKKEENEEIFKYNYNQPYFFETIIEELAYFIK